MTTSEHPWKVGQIFYRYDDRRLWPLDDDFYRIPRVSIELSQWIVTRLTPKGAWIKYGLYPDSPYCKAHFVLINAVKKYAYPTKEEALESFRRRKRRQLALATEAFEYAQLVSERAMKFNPEQPQNDLYRVVP